MIDSLYNYLVRHGCGFKAYDLAELIRRWMRSDNYRGLQLRFLENFAKTCKSIYQNLPPEDRSICYKNGLPSTVAGQWKMRGYHASEDPVRDFAIFCPREQQWQILRARFNKDLALFGRFKRSVLAGKYTDPSHTRCKQPHVFICYCRKCGRPMSYQNLTQHRGKKKTRLCMRCRSVGLGR